MIERPTILCGDVLAMLRTLPASSVHCCVTSPPYYGLRDYGHEGQIGLEPTPEAYVAKMVEVFREVRRVLRDDGTLWLNLGDSYSNGGRKTRDPGQSKSHPAVTGEGNAVTNWRPDDGAKPKDLLGIPWRVAFALQADGWWLRQDIIWHKPNPMPESVTDRCTKAHEYVFLLAKSERYYYDAEALKENKNAEPDRRLRSSTFSKVQKIGHAIASAEYVETIGRNRRSVWTITTKPYSGAHFAVMPPDLVEPCILAGTSEKGCCPACGTPWERVVERVSTGKPYSTGKSKEKNTAGLVTGFSGYDDGSSAPVFRTTGWRPACTCGGSPVPCSVLDPFTGSGTTLAVAARHGRRGVGCELNPEYVALAERRIQDELDNAALFVS